MSRETDTEFLRMVHAHAVFIDAKYLRFTIEERDRLYRIAGEVPPPITHWCPTHRDVMRVLDIAKAAEDRRVINAVAKKLTS